ncbi:iron ABC transporter permease [Terrihabitans soli]|uniref:Iron ABC transporter permease n=1 Tax=Terrihabitans soli TaxID=708113 RepID=A0A6S6QVQ0_9HYPH|nr:iron ABC transporter permease [Terrihabitans soli]BCJ90578.1 iron ABC transporter permease [Terrihabitans soli]
MTRAVTVLLILILALLAASLSLGDYAVPVRDIVQILTGAEAREPQAAMIVLDIRLPRVLTALLVGLALGVGGVIIQAVMRNPLAEPGLLGINSGAAVAAMLLIVQMGEAPLHLLPWFAFAGALAASLAIYLLSLSGGASATRIILIGIGISALCGAAMGFMSAFGDVTAVQRAMIWLSGSVYDSRWVKLQLLFLWLLLPLLLAWMSARELDALGLGDAPAQAIGQRVHLVRGAMILLCSMICGAAVAAAGLIGFVGLVAPHLARHLVGPRHALMMPVAALGGGALVMAADLAGRTLIAPAQLPAGLVTALIGAPFFAYLLWTRRDAQFR